MEVSLSRDWFVLGVFVGAGLAAVVAVIFFGHGLQYETTFRWILEAVVVAAFVGAIGGGIFHLLISHLKPNLNIAPEIAKGTNSEGDTIYRIKVINRSDRDVTDIRAELHSYKKKKGVLVTKLIEMKRSDPIVIPGMSGNAEEFISSFRFITYEDLESIADTEIKGFRFRVFARDSHSGFGELSTMYFPLSSNPIVAGNYDGGETFAISNQSAT